MIEIGKVVNTHGIRGEIKILPLCDDPFIFCDLEYFYIDGKKYSNERGRIHKNNAIVKLAGIDDINSAELFKNKFVTVERELLGELEEGVYYIRDLLGITVKTESGKVLGELEDVIKTGSNDVYQLKNSSILIPALKDVILNVDIENKTMVVRLPEGLIDSEV